MHIEIYSHAKCCQLQAPIKVIIKKHWSLKHGEFRHRDRQIRPVEWDINRLIEFMEERELFTDNAYLMYRNRRYLLLVLLGPLLKSKHVFFLNNGEKMQTVTPTL